VINEHQYEETENQRSKKRGNGNNSDFLVIKESSVKYQSTPRKNSDNSESVSSYRRFIEHDESISSKNESSLSAWHKNSSSA
jgi:hypothetical protein